MEHIHTQQQKPSHVAIMPSPGMGHLIPLVELAKQLVLHHHFLVTFIIPTDGSPMKAQKSVLEALPNSISYILLPPVSFDDLPQDVKAETLIALTVTRSLPALRDSFKVLAESTRVVALVGDLFGLDAFDVAKEFGALSYLFFPTTAMSLSLFFYLPELDERFTCEYRDLPEPVKLPGCVPIRGIDLIDPIQDRKNDAYKRILHNAKRYTSADGIMVNSFIDLEPNAFKALMEVAREGKPPVYAIGPLIQPSLDRGVDGSDKLRVEVNDNGLVGHKDIANYVRGLIDGEEGKLLRNKMNELKDAAGKALSQEGSSTKSLAEVTQIWKSHKK
ncbi:hydroquinone glucosyltransferase-like [Fagus crenata]